MFCRADSQLSEDPIIDDQAHFDVVINRREAARHLLSAAFSVLRNIDFPVSLAQLDKLAVVAKFCLRGTGRIRYSQRPIPKTGDRNSPAVHLPKFDLGVIEFGDDAVPIGHRELVAIAIDENSTNTQRPADPRPENNTVLPPPELAVKAFVAGTDADASSELPFIHAAKNFQARLPIR